MPPPELADLDAIRTYVSELLCGKWSTNGPFRFWDGSFPWRWDRTIFKITDGREIASWLVEEFSLVPVALFRHPLAQALSVSRNEWRPTTPGYAKFLLPEMPRRQRTEYERVRDTGSPIEVGVLDWCLENRSLVSISYDDPLWMTVFYEDLALSPAKEAARLARHFDMDPHKVEVALTRPSRSTRRASTKSTRRLIAAGSNEQVVAQWTHDVSDRDLRRAQGILDIFGINFYSTTEAGPLR